VIVGGRFWLLVPTQLSLVRGTDSLSSFFGKGGGKVTSPRSLFLRRRPKGVAGGRGERTLNEIDYVNQAGVPRSTSIQKRLLLPGRALETLLYCVLRKKERRQFLEKKKLHLSQGEKRASSITWGKGFKQIRAYCRVPKKRQSLSSKKGWKEPIGLPLCEGKGRSCLPPLGTRPLRFGGRGGRKAFFFRGGATPLQSE